MSGLVKCIFRCPFASHLPYNMIWSRVIFSFQQCEIWISDFTASENGYVRVWGRHVFPVSHFWQSKAILRTWGISGSHHGFGSHIRL